jgi:hypothetical protein
MKENSKAVTNMFLFYPFMDDVLLRYHCSDWPVLILRLASKRLDHKGQRDSFFMITSSQAHELNIWVISNFMQKFAEIFASQGASPVSTTPAANFATRTAGVVDTGGKLLSKML